MFLSRLKLNYGSSKDIFLSLQAAHRFVYSGFAEGQTHVDRTSKESASVLYRLETSGDLLVQSSVAPTLPGATVKEFSFAPMPGNVYQFRLKANPTKRVSGGGKRIAVLDRDRLPWLERKADANGFSLVTANVVTAKDYTINEIGVIRTVVFEGVLQVHDAALFSSAFRHGIGAGKAWGCGLLSLALV